MVTYSCQNSQKTATIKTLNNNLMVGEWTIDSSSNRNYSLDKLMIMDNGSFYIFSGSDGGSMWKMGKKFHKTFLVTGRGDTMRINLLDSNRLCISDGWNNTEDFYKRSDYGNYRESLKKYIKSDSLRKKIIGWWKLTASKTPVKLINFGGYYDKFTLNIREDGQAIFYLENNLDSTVNYSYIVNPDGIDFNRGCIVGSDCKVSFDKMGNMKLLLDEKMGDTLLLKRLTEIK